MIKLMYCVRRQPRLSPEDFQSHWQEHHVVAFGGPNNPYGRIHVSYPVIAGGLGPGEREPYDGLGVVWLDRPESVEEMMTSPNIGAALADEALFVDAERSGAILATEEVVVEPEGEGRVVLVECLRRSGGAEEFAAAWREHGAARRADWEEGLLQGYVQSHVLNDDGSSLAVLNDSGEDPERWDGIGMTYFDSVVIAKDYVEKRREALDNGGREIDAGNGIALLARRRTLKHLVR